MVFSENIGYMCLDYQHDRRDNPYYQICLQERSVVIDSISQEWYEEVDTYQYI